MDMKDHPRIWIDPGRRSGAPCVRGHRIAVTDLLAQLADGLSRAEILEFYEHIEDADITAALEFAQAALLEFSPALKREVQLADLMDEVTPENAHPEIPTGPARGKEQIDG